MYCAEKGTITISIRIDYRHMGEGVGERCNDELMAEALVQSVLGPLNTLQINAFLHHLVQGAVVWEGRHVTISDYAWYLQLAP